MAVGTSVGAGVGVAVGSNVGTAVGMTVGSTLVDTSVCESVDLVEFCDVDLYANAMIIMNKIQQLKMPIPPKNSQRSQPFCGILMFCMCLHFHECVIMN